MSYSRQKEVLEMPNLIEVQKDSYQWSINDKSAGGSHEGQIPHEDLMLADLLFLLIVKANLYLQGRCVIAKATAENYQGGLLELYKKIRPGEPLSVESAESLITAMFFDPRRYDLAKVGRYKFNKKLALRNRIRHQILAADASFAKLASILGSSPNTSRISSLVPIPIALITWRDGVGVLSGAGGDS